MAFDEDLAARVRDLLARRKGVTEKKMFGGLAFLLDGNMLVGVRKDSLLARLSPDEGDEALTEPHVSAFEIAGRGRMKGWVVVDGEGLEDDDRLAAWVQRALAFVGRLPPK